MVCFLNKETTNLGSSSFSNNVYGERFITVGKTCGVHCSSTRRLICGTDGKTYSDECSFEQEKCRRNKRLKISYYGTCSK